MGPPTRSVLKGSPSRRRRRLAAGIQTSAGQWSARHPRRCSRQDDRQKRRLVPASAQDIYDAWLSSSGHEKITGGQKAQISAQEGAAFTVWNGYISGRNLKLEPPRRIIQSWRTTKFTDADPDSQIEVLLRPAAGGTMVTVRHSKVPDGHTSYRDGGWQRSYFEPMKQHFKRAR